jgi:hypothetical protein
MTKFVIIRQNCGLLSVAHRLRQRPLLFHNRGALNTSESRNLRPSGAAASTCHTRPEGGGAPDRC